MVLKAGAKRFAIEYPSLSCGGRWQLISLNAWRARFRERLDHGQDKCADNGSVLIQRLNRNQILFVYSNQGEKELTASAILKNCDENRVVVDLVKTANRNRLNKW